MCMCPLPYTLTLQFNNEVPSTFEILDIFFSWIRMLDDNIKGKKVVNTMVHALGHEDYNKGVSVV